MSPKPYPWEATHFTAAAHGDIATLQSELEKGLDVNSSINDDKQSPLSWAAERGYENVVRLLIRRGADVNFSRSSHGRTALSEAVASGHEAVARLLIEAGAHVDISDTSCTPLLNHGVESGRISLVRLLLEQGADVNAKEDHSGETALSLAAAEGHEDMVRMLLQNNASADLADDSHRKPLARAIESGHHDIIRIFANHTEGVAPINADGSRALEYNASQGLTSAMLFSAYTDVPDGSDENRFEWALEKGHVFCAKQLLEQGIDLEHRFSTEMTPLMLVADKGYIELVEFLLEKDVEVDSRDEEGQTPLSHAAENGHAEIVTLLLNHGADLHSEDRLEWTPLTRAAWGGHEVVVSLLLEKGADPDHWDDEGFSPLIHAAVEGHAGVVSLLLDRGVDPDTRDKENSKTVMAWAAEVGHTAVVETLLARNASPNDEEHDITPLSEALSASFYTRDYSLIKLLLKHGAQPFSEVYWDNICPLEVAAANGHYEVVELFLNTEPCSSKVKQDHVGDAIYSAAEKGRIRYLDLLFQHYSIDGDTERLENRVIVHCDCDIKKIVPVLRPYFPSIAGYLDDEDDSSSDDDVVDEDVVESLVGLFDSVQMAK